MPLRNTSQPEADGDADGDGNKEPRGKEDKEDTPHPDRAATGEILQEETSAQVKTTKGSTAVQTQEEDEPDKNGEGGESAGGEVELQDGELEETLDGGVQETLKATPKQLAQWQQQDATLKTIRGLVGEKLELERITFFYRDGLLYRSWRLEGAEVGDVRS